jgi:beta-glucanase (GH16 family)
VNRNRAERGGCAWTATLARQWSLRGRRVVLVCLGIAGALACGEGDSAGNGIPTAPAEWKLYWSDEFEGMALDTTVWKPYDDTYGSGNNELECNSPDNVEVVGGLLIIQARREHVTCGDGKARDFTSGFLGTRENGVYFPRYGRYEMRAKLPHANALWPAFWLRHRDGAAATEVDIMEYFHAQAPGKTTSTLHYDGTSNVAKGSRFFETPSSDPSQTSFHVWAVEIELVSGQVCLKFFVDGTMVDFNKMTAGSPYCFTDAGPFGRYPGEPLFDIAINMAIGGNWIGHPDGPLDTLMNGTKVDPTGVLPTTFPSEYAVDYVRVYIR